MKQHIWILPFVFTLTACNQSNPTTNDKQTDAASKNHPDTLGLNHQRYISDRLTFKNIEEVVKDKKANVWIEVRDSSESLALHFNLISKDTLSVSYSSECWLMYPLKTDNDKIIVYWDTLIDSKYDFDITTAINKTDKKYIGKPFMILELVNDTTLKAIYPIPDLIKKINSSSNERNFFPDKFVIAHDF